ncbi:MAG: HipA N-terminal domain-containing protein [Melioribacteraceae bacterium]|nr:HipA N-terminal domain-containing protein [Melioribacteraceae bacterium]MCO6472360.1 HipA N-terminal domain-containing protein [Melioribacteraceae bacterium]MDD3557997.1 HipA N-terminal domain-containing protein [Melioribacteraceae bacterium]
MKREAKVFFNENYVGTLSKVDGEYLFQYDDEYLQSDLPPISLSFPKQKEAFKSNVLFPFFFGLLSEGENKELQCRSLKIDENDFFSLLLKTANNDTIGGVRVVENEN